jgi:hypothetical protein
VPLSCQMYWRRGSLGTQSGVCEISVVVCTGMPSSYSNSLEKGVLFAIVSYQ